MDAAVAMAMSLAREVATDEVPASSVPLSDGFGLSPRERDVLRLLVEGRSDREIADSLFISIRTAEKHVAAVLGKFRVPTRTAAVAFAFRNGLDGLV